MAGQIPTKEKILPALMFSSARADGGCTAHALARILDATPQYTNRCLKRLFADGKVAYREEPHRGNSGFKRVWTTVKNARKSPARYTFPQYIQEELL